MAIDIDFSNGNSRGRVAEDLGLAARWLCPSARVDICGMTSRWPIRSTKPRFQARVRGPLCYHTSRHRAGDVIDDCSWSRRRSCAEEAAYGSSFRDGASLLREARGLDAVDVALGALGSLIWRRAGFGGRTRTHHEEAPGFWLGVWSDLRHTAQFAAPRHAVVAAPQW